MIAFLKGTLVAKAQDLAYIEVNGVGYAVGMATSCLAKLPEVGNPVQVYTYLYLRDDAIALFGFLSVDEKALFLRMITVSGVGPKVALASLSVFTPDELVSAICSQDIETVSRIPGVGKKTASRIVLELKGSLDAGLIAGSGFGSQAPSSRSAQLQGAKEALMSMGFTSSEIDLALKDAPAEAAEKVLLQYALKRLGE